MAQGNPYFTGVTQTLEEYVPMPMDMLFKAGQAVQGRYDSSIADNSAMETGLASIETRSSGHKDYVNNMLKSYRTENSALIDKYGGKLENPEFKREQNKIINKYKNDPTWNVIKENNKNVEKALDREGDMKQRGQLFISGLSKFSGKDADGNLTAYTGSPEAVNTLDEWKGSFALAHQSSEDIGNKTTNRRNLNKTRQAIEADIKNGGVQSTRLMQAYMEKGMNPQQAKQAMLSNVSNLVNSYAVKEEWNKGLLSMQQSERHFQSQRADRAADRANDLDIAKIKAKGKAGSNADGVLTPSFNKFNNNIGSIGTANISNDEGDVNTAHIFGSGKSANGVANRTMKNETISGSIYNLSEGKLKSSNKSINITEGTEIGAKNAWVRSDTGELIVLNSSTGTPKINIINGKPHTEVTRNGKKVAIPIEERTMIEYSYNENSGKKDEKTGDNLSPSIKSFFKEATPEEAVDQMGYSDGYWKGMGQTKPRKITNAKGNIDIDYNFLKNSQYAPMENTFKDIENKYNSKKQLTDKEIQLINDFGSYDSRKSLWESKSLPKYNNQGKLKNIANED